jgi:DNA-binding GntR family transcriptional regulator
MTDKAGSTPHLLAGRSKGGPRRPQTAADFVAQSLRQSILNGELQAGTRLGVAQIASTFDVSATPVREALRDLSREGLVQFDAYRGGTVNAFSQDEVRDIVRIRQVLEPIAINEAIANMTEDVLAEAEEILDHMSLDHGWNAWVLANRNFHNVLYSTSPSTRLISIIQSLQEATAMFVSNALERTPSLQTRAHGEHGELLDAFGRGDVERAIAITLRHLAIPFEEVPQER